MADETSRPPGELVLYETEDGRARIECRFEGDTIWLSQAQMAVLFDRSVPTINEHLRGVFDDGELREEATVRKFRMVRTEGNRSVSREVEHYALEALLAVGYRVKSQRGVQFRRWASEILKEYMVKGFALDDRRLKNPPQLGAVDHFGDLLARIRDIRASEKRMYLRVKEIFALAADYSSSLPSTRPFFQKIQNKLHFATTGMTAPELIRRRSQAELPNMGLTTWDGDRVQKADVTVAKNYLREGEIAELNRIVTMWLDFAEDQATRKQQVFLKDWDRKLDEFLRFNDRNVLPDTGKVTRDEADHHASAAYETFAERRRATLEEAGEVDALKSLEAAAKKASPPREKKGKKP